MLVRCCSVAAIALSGLVAGCGNGSDTADLPQGAPNILLILADDVGVEMLSMYQVGDDAPPTPQLDALAARGIRFNQAWSNPTCSPTRASIQTGRHANRTGMGWVIAQGDSFALPLAETTLPELLGSATPAYATAIFGKWHLGAEYSPGGGNQAPNTAGFDYFSGTLQAVPKYSSWIQVVDGETTERTGYLTAAQADDALAWIKDRTGPWYAYVALQAPYEIPHLPPSELYTVQTPAECSQDRRACYKAALEAMDTKIGTLLAGIPADVLANTNVIFMGDNGTPNPVIGSPYSMGRGKLTLYEGGIRVPLIISGPAVLSSLAGTTSDELVHAVDLFATVATMAGVSVGDLTLDGESLVPILLNQGGTGDTLFSQSFEANGFGPSENRTRNEVAIRNAKYKLIRFCLTGAEELYDLEADPFELDNLLPAQEQYAKPLRQALASKNIGCL